MTAPSVDDYLLDTSVLSLLLDSSRPDRQVVAAWEAGLSPDSRRLISVVALSELEFGRNLMAAEGRETPALDALLQDVRRFDLLDVTSATSAEYARLKAAVVTRFLPSRMREGGKKRWGNPETWRDEFTGDLLQIQENDLWQCAQALERDVVFVTCDKGAERLHEASGGTLRVVRLASAAL